MSDDTTTFAVDFEIKRDDGGEEIDEQAKQTMIRQAVGSAVLSTLVEDEELTFPDEAEAEVPVTIRRDGSQIEFEVPDHYSDG